MSKSCLICILVFLIRVYLISWQLSAFVNNASAGFDGITFKINLSTAALVSLFFSCSGEATRFLFHLSKKHSHAVDGKIKILLRHASE